MQYKKNLSILVLTIGLVHLNLFAQVDVSASGGDASSVSGSTSYSVGQVVYTTNTGIDGSVAQGVQQPYEISIVTEIEEAKEISLSFSVYPNPTTNFFKLNIGNYTPENLNYQLYDASSKIIESKKVFTIETSIFMENSARGIYFFKIIENNKEVKTFKIIKTQ